MAEERKEIRKAPTRLYNTAMINSLIEDIGSGYEVDTTPFFEGDTELRMENVTFEMTDEECEEYMKCAGDSMYFIKTYVKFMTDNGRDIVNLRDYQEHMVKLVTDEHYDESINNMVPDNGRIIIMAARQSGKTTTTAAYMLWYLCFHTDRNVGIMANKLETAKEIVDKVNDMYRGLPYFIKPGVKRFMKLGASFDNGCKLISSATTKNTSIGFTINGILYLDEFAHIEDNLCRKFWRSVYPTLSSSKTAQLIITSTPNGVDNKFFEIWDDSINNRNGFANMRVDYYQVPEHNTEEWVKKTIAEFGLAEFNQEFLLQFNSSSSSILSGEDQMFMDRLSRDYIPRELDGRSRYLLDKRIMWDPSFDPNGVGDRDLFIFLIDLAEGGGDGTELAGGGSEKKPDFCSIQILKVRPNSVANMRRFRDEGARISDAFRFQQVGRFCCDDNDEEYTACVTAALALDLFKSHIRDNVRVMVEMNFQGKSYLNILQNHAQYYDDLVLSTYHTKPIPGENSTRSKKRPGFKTNADKNHYCAKGAAMIRKKRIIVTDRKTTAQMKAFGYVKGKLKGIGLHDDLSMPMFNHIYRMIEVDEFIEWLDDFFISMTDARRRDALNRIIRSSEDGESGEMSDGDISGFYSDETPNPYSIGGGFQQVQQGGTYASLMRGGIR